ncbi:MAG: hypothetical protein JSW50_16900 [Candidatus Latescibacterota bacterium]|nr:MAG: hypothetical protein JSW50_16900 [Candidatus Latescibacterota bacterium]
MGRTLVYLGTFVIAFSALALEVTLVRLLSVVTWYHLAFFAISTAILGMTAGATRVYLQPQRFSGERLSGEVARSCLYFALVIPVSLITLCMLPLELYGSVMSIVALFVATIACSLPYYFSGTVITAVLTKYPLPIGKLYASDLLGGSLGCLFVLAGLELLDAPSLILLCSAGGMLGASCFARHGGQNRWIAISMSLVLFFVAAAVVNSLGTAGIRPLYVKGRFEPPHMIHKEDWNSFSHVVVYHQTKTLPQYWGPSPVAPADAVFQYPMNIDGAAGTTMKRFNNPGEIDHLKYDVTNVAYYLRSNGGACVIGVGAGRDVQSALLFGHERVTGIEVNPVFIKLINDDFREFVGIADREEVNLVVDEARSYLSRTDERFSIIQMSLIDTWAATGAGAFSLSENALYTTEAWEIIFDRLTDDGIFTVSRWHDPANIGETGRLLSLAVASLLQIGVDDPSKHIALVTTDRISTLLIRRSPFDPADLDALSSVCAELQYRIEQIPGTLPEDDQLREIAAAKTLEDLLVVSVGKDLNFEPPTDENPYFFNMVKLNRLGVMFSARPGVVRGNMIATLSLLALLAALLIVTLLTIVVPLMLRERFGVASETNVRTLWSGALYFSLIGAAFMFLEIALIQRLTIFLGHPVYALGILLFTLIASTGVGSLLSERLPLTRPPWLFVFPLATSLTILLLRYLLGFLISGLIAEPILVRIIVSILVIFPMGMLMGFFFPTGMRLASRVCSGETPWYWALNGILGVLCSALAVLFSIFVGISLNFYVAAVCYAVVIIALFALKRAGEGQVV